MTTQCHGKLAPYLTKQSSRVVYKNPAHASNNFYSHNSLQKIPIFPNVFIHRSHMTLQSTFNIGLMNTFRIFSFFMEEVAFAPNDNFRSESLGTFINIMDKTREGVTKRLVFARSCSAYLI